ncbi:isocitrate lyase/PEP mutase family protein [Agromyces atrinae]|uniref:2-methylisocitrate lyase-like PEP mutase family enzyme n=1 Tax=Agromyces atrinae TaxID=592376 RepID=A0A4V1R2S1_9MICO|nr:isocitrate lyase/phosphoenolpyruvate mutase family protein [Agromyces atrinae]NYD67665.1 2-methylisocitrate lyase-like PEP mutase family enzyme [Agromyces atrinae]RXZ88136.1 isocitrate lyase/phosphoenolpyruvate mutase family protein [Agromyces atrinae]
MTNKVDVLRQLHTDEALLQVVNVWDAISARAIAELPDTKAIATAGHSIAASHGYDDGRIPVELMIAAVGRIAAATDLPVTADLDDGYADAGETVRQAIGVGIVGANVEDRLKPLDESVAVVRAIIAAGEAEGTGFALNARTDAFVRGGDRPVSESVADAIERGKAYLDAGATCIFVPGNFGEAVVSDLVAGIGERRVSLIGFPEIPAPERLQSLGVARLSYGPLTQRVALQALQDAALHLYRGGKLPEDLPALN